MEIILSKIAKSQPVKVGCFESGYKDSGYTVERVDEREFALYDKNETLVIQGRFNQVCEEIRMSLLGLGR